MRHTKSISFQLVSVLAICLFALSPQSSAAAPCEELSFGAPTYFSNGLGNTGLAKGDLNGDGNVDLVASNENSGTVRVHFGDGNGGFPTSLQLFTNTPSSVAVADFNSDGNLDIVASNRDISGLTVWLSLGGGAFGVPVQRGIGPGPAGVATGDFNNDGNIDIVASNGGGTTISLLLGTPAGAFPAVTSVGISASGSWGITTADINGDGNLDVATANRGSSSMSILLGNGAGAFVSRPAILADREPFSISTGDFNQDGFLDLVTVNQGVNNLSVALNDALGSFSRVFAVPSGAEPFSVVADDIDADGLQDIVLTNRGSNNMSVYRGRGGPRADFAVNSGPRSMVVGDLNGDGSLDVAAGLDSGNIAVLLNACVSNTTPAITASSVSRRQDAGSSNSTIASVDDAEDNPADLAVTVNGAGSATVNGVTVSNISVGAGGNVTADVSASCGASDATFMLEVTDSGDLSAMAMLEVDVLGETTPPVINDGNPLPNVTVYLPQHSSGSSMVVNFDLPTASDNCTESPQVTSSPASGSTFNVGSTTVTVSANDEAGNTTTATFSVKVLFNFGGFGPPLDPLPEANVAIAGLWIPVNFSLSGNKGLNIFAAGYPASSPVPCDQNVPGPAKESTQTPPGLNLLYIGQIDRYLYVWKTKSSWRRSCRILILKFADGSEHHAKIKFL